MSEEVKLADEDLIEATSITTSDDGKQAVVKYTTAYKNVNGLSALMNIDFSKPNIHKAYFTLYDDGWKFEKK